MTQTIAFIGLGNMGGGMAANLLAKGYAVRAFDLSEDALSKAEGHGAVRAASAADAVAGADAVVTMLPAGTHVEAVYNNEVFGAAKAGALFLDCSTIDVATARRVAEAAQAAGFAMVDAPVSGGDRGGQRGHADFHGRRHGRGFRCSASHSFGYGQGRDPRRSRRQRAGGQNLQQHVAGRHDGRDLRNLRHGAEAGPRPADIL